ncbi:MAG: YfhO family protein, partial [Eubacterium sp.]|nr:YfhO family protein [Eubacterium sp.]
MRVEESTVQTIRKGFRRRTIDKRLVILPLAAFLIALVMELLIFAIKGLAPFGSKSVLAIDLYHQYAPFLMELRHRILGGEDLLYSWQAGLGRDLYVQTAYYTTSILDYIYLLLPEKMISECVALLIMVKTALCAPAFQIYLGYRYKRHDAQSVLFSLLYAFCGFATCYYWNIMWLDIVFLFPFLIIGLRELMFREKPLIYWISLALIMYANFYLAVMVCIFIVLYVLKLLIGSGRRLTKKKDREWFLWTVFLFIVFSILAAITAGFILAPAALAISQNVRTTSEVPNFEIYKCVPQLLSAHFTGARPSVMSLNEDAPNLFSGVLTLMLLPLYWKASTASKREKRSNVFFLILLLVCSIIKPLDFIVHGFYFPANLPHRYVFIYSFVLVSMAYDAAGHLDELTDRMVYIEAAVLAMALSFLEFIVIPAIPDIDPVLDKWETIMNIGLMFAYGFLLTHVLTDSRTKRRLCKTAIFGLVVFECVYMGVGCIEQTTERDDYVASLTAAQEEDAYLAENTDELFYRTDFARGKALNEGSVYAFNGFSCFSSMVPARLAEVMKTFGAVQT